jgi:hypothetical protein
VLYLSMNYPCYPGLGRTLVLLYHASFAESGLNHENWLTFFVEFVSLGDPSRRMLMMVLECTCTCYVLFWIVVVPASDLKDLFVERVTMFTMQSHG